MKQNLDNQMLVWSQRMIKDLKLDFIQTNKLGSTIETEIHSLSLEKNRALIDLSCVTPQNRLDELVAFQGWMDFAHRIRGNPYVTRAQVITQNYICFVYLGDALFKTLKAVLPSPFVTGRCCRFLLNNPVRAFRNAIAHSNWRYTKNFSGLEFWAKKGSEHDEPLTYFEVSNTELGYWQAMSRCVAYSAYLALTEVSANKPLKQIR
jgi:hypothetical protein